MDNLTKKNGLQQASRKKPVQSVNLKRNILKTGVMPYSGMYSTKASIAS